MCVCMYVCMYVCIYACLCLFIHIFHFNDFTVLDCFGCCVFLTFSAMDSITCGAVFLTLLSSH